jgi:histidyl-tRNA synthetase
MVLNVREIPEDVYNILNKKALRRNLTPYIVELVKKDLSNKLILEKLDQILNKLDNVVIKKSSNDSEIEISLSQKSDLEEGSIISNITDVKGEINDEDLDEQDY